MSFSVHAKTLAGRWMDRHLPMAIDLSALDEPAAPRPRYDEDPQPFSTPRAACTLQVREQVWVTDVWRTIERVEYLKSPGAAAQTLLHLSDGSILGSRFDFEYVSRDEDEQAAAEVTS